MYSKASLIDLSNKNIYSKASLIELSNKIQRFNIYSKTSLIELSNKIQRFNIYSKASLIELSNKIQRFNIYSKTSLIELSNKIQKFNMYRKTSLICHLYNTFHWFMRHWFSFSSDPFFLCYMHYEILTPCLFRHKIYGTACQIKNRLHHTGTLNKSDNMPKQIRLEIKTLKLCDKSSITWSRALKRSSWKALEYFFIWR